MLVENKSVIDFAPSKALSGMINKLRPSEYTTVDKFMDSVDIKADLTNLDMFQEDDIDFIICSHVLEHIEDDNKAISEIYRVLKPGGVAIMIVPIGLDLRSAIEGIEAKTDADRMRIYGQSDHIRIYNRQTFVSRLRKAKFKVKTFSGWWRLWGDDFSRFGFSKTSRIYVCSKR
jgi:predicted SAM-dependent methyltransferase